MSGLSVLINQAHWDVVHSNKLSGLTVPRAVYLEKIKNCAEQFLHIDHLFARMQRLNTYEAKTNTMTRIGSNLSQVVPPPFSCE
jgi:hypothetical protein